MYARRTIISPTCPLQICWKQHDEIKIFDLGLSRPIPSTTDVHLLSMAGSYRYMAPEIATRQPYNHHCDVYSFVLVVWEMMSLERPYSNIKCAKALKESIHERHERPKLPKKWTQSLRKLISAGWDHDQFRRPDMSTLGSLLRDELLDTGEGNEPNIDERVQRGSFKLSSTRDKQPSIVRMPSGEDLSQILKDFSSECAAIDRSRRH